MFSNVAVPTGEIRDPELPVVGIEPSDEFPEAPARSKACKTKIESGKGPCGKCKSCIHFSSNLYWDNQVRATLCSARFQCCFMLMLFLMNAA